MNIFKKLKTWAILTRFEHSILSSFAVFISLIISAMFENFDICSFNQISNNCINPFHIIYALLVPIFINLGAFSLNDYFDIETDKKNNRFRPLVKEEINPTNALIFSFISIFAGTIFGFLINFNSGLIAGFFSLFSILYNYKLKDIAIVGNLFISISMAISFIFAPIVIGIDFFNIPSLFWLFAIGAGLAGMGREILKTTQDVSGDLSVRKSKTLPILIGTKNANKIGALFFFAFSFCTLSLFIYDFKIKLNLLSAIILILSSFSYFAFGYKMFNKNLSVKLAENIRKLSLQILAADLIAIMICLF